MKFFAPIVVGFIAFFSAQVDANGVCYDPDHTSGKSASTVQADMKTIAGAGFSSVRTYISTFGGVDMGPIITGAGLTAVLGVPYPQSDYQEQMEAAIKAANAGGVYAIMVGNENLAGASSVPSGMIDVINQIKSRVSVKVGTVQRNTEVIGYKSISGWSDLVSACDVLGVNVHPFFNPGTTAEGAIDVVDKQWQTMMSNFGDKLLLTETGWPSSGSVSGNTGSLVGEQTFYSAYQQWSSGLSEKFYFQFFDIPSKPEAYEQTFGLYTADSQSKFTMSQSPSTSTPQQQQQQTPTTSAPTTAAPAPTTAAPTPEPTTAIPQPTTATPTPTPETYQNSGSHETNTTSSVSSTTGSDESVHQGSTSLSGSDNDVKVSSSSKDSSPTKQDTKTNSNSDKTSETTQSTGATSSIGKSSETQQEHQTQQTASKGDDTAQQANTQSSSGSSGGVVGLAVAGGVCAMLVAFGFIYQARKRAQELEDEDKDVHFSTITPVENICSL